MLQEQEADLALGDQESLSDDELERTAIEGMAMDDIGELMQQASASRRSIADDPNDDESDA
jgi:hypothetical protein